MRKLKLSEKRTFNFAGAVRSKDAGGEKIIEGHAAVFEQSTTISASFVEVIERGAFDGCDLSDVALFVNHDASKIPLARTTSGTLSVSVDSIGLNIRARLDVENNPDAKTLYSAVERGDLSGMSFAFIVADDDWQDLDSDMPTRRIKKIAQVYEVSACTYPAYETTDIQARAAKMHKGDMSMKSKSILEEAGRIFQEPNCYRAVNSPYSLRAVMVRPAEGTAASIVVPTIDSTTITPSFNVVSSLIDGVTHLQLNGGESYRQPYSMGVELAGYSGEGVVANTVENLFGFSEINCAKITAYVEMTEELEKLPAASYADVVFQNIRTSIRQLLSREILFGTGLSENGNNYHLTGIANSAAIDASTNYSISQITDTTLDEIVYHYGSDEDLETPATLIVNKLDLMALAKVRSSTREKFYEINFTSGNSGTISGVPFIINSALKPISITEANGGASSGDICMVYGNLKNYQLTSFRNLEVKRSNDYRFPFGLSCFRGVLFCGGNVVKHNGFLKILKN